MSLKRKRLSIKEKLNIVAESEKYNSSARKLAEKFGVGRTQVNDILKNKVELKKMFEEEGCNADKKRKFPKTEGFAIDQLVYEWFCKARNKNIPISGTLIREKALEVSTSLKLSEFKASTGWLNKFCKRHNINFKTICGESADVDEVTVEDWKTKLTAIIKEYDTKDIFNADETGLYYMAMPNKTFALKNDKCAGKKSAKQRVTLLFCCSMHGEKENPLVIGKSKNPRCFKGAHVDKLPIEWVSNKKAWMTTDIMTSWLKTFDTKMKRQGRKVLLFLDNATSHPKIELENVRIIFFPPNTTSHCQPLDQGIIQNFKLKYRQFFIKRLLTFTNTEETMEKAKESINLASTMVWISTAWKNVTSNTIKKCFQKAGFATVKGDDAFDEEDDIPLSQLSSILKNMPGSPDLKEYLTVDSDVPTENPSLEMQGIIQEFTNNKDRQDSTQAEEEEDEGQDILCSSINNMSKVCEKLRDIQNFLVIQNKDELAVDIAHTLMKFESEITKIKIKNLKQTTINQFFTI
ncbi:tigger transposable element-derived protein 6-like [Sitophilus oryzae]|uniref:Tigger transposable element-derived protein 6-like n=1 Tax=Sitophilus oryzae TaxID=7048 RepID=A0A6J2YW07_SITOR|nr:tigger transposable element-derived protein 6-like [Sitophilus oryzae]